MSSLPVDFSTALEVTGIALEVTGIALEVTGNAIELTNAIFLQR